MSIYGYCRISSKHQSIDRQIRNIKAFYPDAHIYQETFTGTKIFGRRQFELLLKKVRSGDIIVFDSVSRMSRNAEEGFALYEKLYNNGIELIFLKEPHISTYTYKKAAENNISMTGTSADLILEGVNRYLMQLAREQIRLAFNQSEKEVHDLRQRTKEGIETARLNGKQVGQRSGNRLNIKKKAPIKKLIRKYSRNFDGDLKDSVTISAINGTCYTDADGTKKLYHISSNTYYKYKKELAEELQNEEFES